MKKTERRHMGKREETKEKMVASFKNLSLKKPIQKITVQEIVEGAGVIRSTFYNHFQDKYQLLEWIFTTKVLFPAKPLIQNNMLHEAVVLIFVNLLKDKEFYGRVYRLEGQNSFESIVKSSLYDTLLDFMNKRCQQGKAPVHRLLSKENLAEYYSQFLGFIVIAWMRDGMEASPQEMGECFDYIKDHSLYESIREME